jgi:hypothetical protein
MPASEGNSGSPSVLSNSNRIPAASIARRIAAMLLAMGILCTIARLIGRQIKLHEGVYGKVSDRSPARLWHGLLP